jgi:hypothetical protein
VPKLITPSKLRSKRCSVILNVAQDYCIGRLAGAVAVSMLKLLCARMLSRIIWL